MEVKEFLATLEKMNFSLSVDGGNLILKADKKKLSKEQIEAIKANKDIINYIRAHKEELIEYISIFSEISVGKKAKGIASIYRLSSLQQGMLFHGLYDSFGSYIMQFGWDLVGVNLKVLLASWSEVIKRHTILRSAFYYDSFSIPVQCVFRDVDLPVEELDYRGIDAASQQIALLEYEAADYARGFDFKAAPLMRLALIRLKEDRYRMVWASHHLLFDGWSLPILVGEFLNAYELLISGQALPSAEEDRYEDYIRYLERRDKRAEEQYWRDYLKGLGQGTLLPFIGTTADRTKGKGQYETLLLRLDEAATARIQEFAQSNRLTMNTLMQGVWALLLHRYTGSNDVVYGVVVSGRPDELKGVEHRVGMYINTLAFKAVVDEQQETVSWLQGLQADQVSSRQYQYTPLQDVQGWTGIKGDLFDSLLVFENYPVNKLVDSKAWSLQVENVKFTAKTNYPLTLDIGSSDELRIRFSYNTELLEHGYATAIRDQFEHVLLQITSGQADKLSDIRILTGKQEWALLVEFNATEAAYPKEKSIIDLFEEQVRRDPEATALIFENLALSYKELNNRSNQMARYLQNQGVKAETLVPICMERGPEMVIVILGIMKAGGAYVPIDPAYPEDRISYMLDDTGASIVLSSKRSSDRLRGITSTSIIELNGDWNLIKDEKSSNLKAKISPEQLAYVIYTSGSTGKPKGVMIEHRSLINYISNSEISFVKNGGKANSGSFIHLSYTFDASITALFTPLISGKYLVIGSNDSADVFTDRNLKKYAPYDFIKITPSHIGFLPTAFKNADGSWLTHNLVIGGEALRLSQLDPLIKAGIEVEIINEYGPTEATVGSSIYVFNTLGAHEFTGNEIPIGKPLSNTKIYILNSNGELSPVGVSGEIYIGGSGIARGYLNNTELTAGKFMKDPFSRDAAARLYKTGDLGRWLPDGNIQYMGRIDDQVKIRGYRIELGEIESVLMQSELIDQAVVLAKEDSSGNKRLVGYIVSSEAFDRQAIQNYLNTKLPEYMVPALWIELEIIPLTPNGKVDRKALPDPEGTMATGAYIAPRNETESKLTEIWQELLEMENVGMTDDFFDLGGHSLLAIRLISVIRKTFETELQINDVFSYPTIASLGAYLDEQNKGTSTPTIVSTERPEYIPLSFSQERLWFIDRLEGSVQYHIPAVLRLKGSLDREALEKTLRGIINRHEVLRTVILEHEDQGYQHILPADGWSLGIAENLGGGEAGLSKFTADLISKPFDLSADYMLRADLIKTGKEDNILVVTMHHIASDGWSASILVKEVVALYEGYAGNVETHLPELSIQYADYAIWQRRYMQGGVLEDKLGYWKQKLEGVAPLQLPTDYGRPAVQSSRGATSNFKIDQSLSAQLAELSHQRGATLYMILLAAFKVLLYRYTNQEDICVGTLVAGRNQQELEGLIGFFINTLALRSEVRGEMAFSELLEEIKTTTLEAYSHQEVPFEKVVDAVVKDRDISRSPLFQVLFSLQNTPEVPELKLGDLHLTTENQQHTTSKFDLSLFIRETSAGIQGTVEYCTDLYNEGTIERMISHYINLLESIVSLPENQVSHLGMLSAAEQETLLEEFNATEAAYPKEKSMVGLFEEQVRKSPDATAIVFEKEQLSYKELNKRSNQLARYLQKQGVKAGTLVPICVERSVEMVIGMLGILKAGGAYVPIDPEYPQDRISYMLEDTGASIVLSSKESREKLNVTATAQVIELDGDWEQTGKENSSDLKETIPPKQLAYVIYTSGSTGRPKGVMIEHGSAGAFIAWCRHEFACSEYDIVYATTSICFDLSVYELFYPLSTGKPVRIVENGLAISKYLAEDTNILLNTVPSVIESLLNEKTNLSGVKVINMAGEPIPARVLEGLDTTKTEVRNLYGPTEDTTYSTMSVLENGKPITIGKPIWNTRIYILNKDKALSPVGIAGEICIGGAGIARGYLNRPELTAEKFIKDPFAKETGSRLYRTGDLGRWLPDGNIEYMGRIDDQVKIRGYRIELGEIESVLNQSGLIQQAVVLAKADSSGSKRLVGYVVANGDYDKQAIISYLQGRLPEYMVPALWVELESLPLTPNGKIDKKALPEADVSDLVNNTYVAPRNELEEKLAAIWQEMLGLERVGIYDNFFELGGHSLLAMRVISMIRRELDIDIAIKDLFIYPRIEKLSVFLNEQSRGSLLPPIAAEVRPLYIPLSFSQERLWFIDQLEGSVKYHMPAVLRLKGNLNIEALKHTLAKIIDRHEILRTVILEHEGRGYQQIMPVDNGTLGVIEGPAKKDRTAGLLPIISGLTSKPFDLSKDYMLRADLIKLGGEDHLLVVTMHHIASDGWSISILVKEVIALYEGCVNNLAVALPDLKVQYADYSIWQQKYMQGVLLESKLGYWKEKLEDVAMLQLPADYSRPAIQSSRGAARSFKISPELTAGLQVLSHQEGATLYMTMLAAFKVLLYRYSGQEDICIGTPIAGRNQQELEGLIGFFVNTLALRSRVREDMSFIKLLEAVKETTLEAYGHQDVPFEKVVDAVVKERDMSRNPLFQVMLIFENTPDVPELKMGELSLTTESQEHATSKVDISLFIRETSTGIKGTVEYATDLYKEETIDRMIGHYTNLLRSIVASPQEQVGRLGMLSVGEEKTLLVDFNATEADYPKDKSIVDLFEEQVIKTPAAVAIVFENEQLTYKELNEHSNQLARYIQKKGVKAETLVPICLERSLEMIIGILGVMKAGGAYVPVDPEYPQERISYMLEDTSAAIILSSKASREKLNGNKTVKVIALDSDWELIEKEQSSNLKEVISPKQLAYVIYTSGSTGKPKGAMNEHMGVVNRLTWAQNYFKLSSRDTVLQKTTFCFDVSVWELLWPLLAGARLVFAKPGSQGDSAYLRELIDSQKITMLHFVPSMLSVFLSDLEPGNCKGLENVLCSGEALRASQVQTFGEKLPGVKLHNLYGPTEAAIDVTYWSYLNKGEAIQVVPIGKPVSNTRIYILSNEKELVPTGVAGEIYIGGVQVGRGYLNREELTKEKFLSDPFSKEAGARLYKTGDLGRWLADGNIEYLGRIDDQVKIRGYRIELGEIESILNQSELIQQAVVLAKEDKQGNKRLAGYVVPDGEFDKQAVQTYLNTKLPEYMVPALWVALESIPLTANGKIDRKALPDPEISDMTTVYVAPRNETEAKLTEIWQELLGVERVGVYDNFFELGGDSILTIQVVSRMRRSGYEMQPKDIFNHQDIAGLSAAIGRGTEREVSGEQGLLSGTFGLLPIQSWYLERGLAEVSHFNQSVLLKIKKSVPAAVLASALEQLMRQHDALRLVFEKSDGIWQQNYGAELWQLLQEDLQDVTPESLSAAISARSDKHQRSLSIELGDLLRMVWMQMPEREETNRLLIVIHHLAVDGVSWRILLEDLEQLLDGQMEGKQVSLGAKSSSYRQWQSVLVNYGGSRNLQGQKNYWGRAANSYEPLPQDLEYSGQVLVKDNQYYQVRLGAEQTRYLLQEVPKVYHTEINDLLLGALSATLCEWLGKSHVVIGLEGHGRESVSAEINSSHTVGWFTSLYPVVLKTAADAGTIIKGVKEEMRRVPDKGIGYGVLKYINKAEELQGRDPWDIIFNYLGQLDTAVRSGSWLALAKESGGAEANEGQVSGSKLSVNSSIYGGELVLDWSYSSMHYNRETIGKLADNYINQLRHLIAHCLEQGKSGSVYTPSDYGLSAEVTYQELDVFLEEAHRGEKIKDQVQGIYQLSGLQQGMLFHGLYDSSGSYIEQFGCDLRGVNQEVLLSGWSSVIRRHSILRSAFYYDSFKVPVQCVFREADIPLEELDYRGMDAAVQASALQAYEAADRARGFDFKTAPLMRLGLIRLEDDRYRMLWTWHHLLFDGWSMLVLIEEFLNTYELLISGQHAAIVPEDRFEDYIRYLEQRDKEAEEDYWRNYLGGISQGTLLPFIRTTAERTKGRGKYESLSMRLDGAATTRIQEYAQSQRLTVNTLMQGIWALLLHKYTGDPEVLYGVVVSGRPDELPGIEQRVGMYINTLTFKAVFNEGQETVSWLQGLQADQVSSREYQYSALQDVQGWTGIKGDLFDTILVFENYPVSKLISSKTWSLQVENVEVAEQTNYPLTIIMGGSDELSITFSYNTELLEETYITAIRDQFGQVLQQITDGHAGTISDVRLLTASQEQILLNKFNATEAPYPKDKSVVELFEDQVIKSPDSIALVFEKEQLTYKELNERSNQLARYLQKQGVKAETLVPVCIERGLEMVIGILGILKAGGAYVPIDPDYPQDRISYMLEDTGAKLVLSSKKSRERFGGSGITVIELDGDRELIGMEASVNADINISTSQLAYVIYTSGSTGKPKGVMIEHRSLVNLLTSIADEVSFTPDSSFLSVTTFSFDICYLELYMPLISGAKLVIVSRETASDGFALKESLSEYRPTHMQGTPSTWQLLAEAGWKNDEQVKMLIGGEAVKEGIKEYLTKIGEVWNVYGPTETTIWSTIKKLAATEKVTIGKPVSNTQIYILNGNNALSPVGVSGEICIGGDGLARGYLNRPELTAEKFIKNPFGEEPGARLYRTGDLGRWLPDGNIECLGRIDDQVKIRGYRIELGEIESVLNQSGLVSQAVVLAKTDSSGNRRLVGYTVPQGTFDKQAITSYLQGRLPEYMVPVLWVELESLPLTPNGKIDRKALPDPEITNITAEYAAPRNETEAKLTEIWQELLGVERIGIYDNFFELGGHSLLVMRAVSLIRRELLITIPVHMLFQFASISDLSKYLEIQTISSLQEKNTEEFDEVDL